MTHGRALRRYLPLIAAVLLTASCVHYPTVEEAGGIQFKPDRARAVRQSGAAVCYLDLNSTGKFGDTLKGARSAVAKRVLILAPSGDPVDSLSIPGQSVVRFAPDAHRIVLADLTHQLQPGEVIIVTLLFERHPPLGVITVVE